MWYAVVFQSRWLAMQLVSDVARESFAAGVAFGRANPEPLSETLLVPDGK
jgi:hypothetical protein